MLRVRFDPYPLLVTEVWGRITDADIEQLQRENEKALERGGRIISLVDVTGVTAVPTAVQRKTYAAWREKHFKELRKHIVAVAFVVGDRVLLRGALTALTWLAKHPSPEGVFVERAEAMSWLFAKLEHDRRG